MNPLRMMSVAALVVLTGIIVGALGGHALRGVLDAAQLHAAFPTGTPQVTIQLFSAATRQGVPEAETTIAAWVPAPAWQNADADGDKKERPRGQGE